MTLPPPKFFFYVVKVLTKKMTRQMSTPEGKKLKIFFSLGGQAKTPGPDMYLDYSKTALELSLDYL